MRALIFTLCFFALFGFHTNAQTQDRLDQVNYTLTYRLDVLTDTTKSKRKSELMLLRVGDSIHQFLGKPQYLMDSLFTEMEKQETKVLDMGEVFSVIGDRPIEQYKLYKNTRQKKYTHMETVLLSKYRYSDSLGLKWVIQSDRDTMGGYVCQKAITHFAGRNYAAWFTMDLPLQAAPYKFDGLPGVVVKVADTRAHYLFQLESFTKNTEEAYIFKQKSKAQSITRRDFIKKKRTTSDKSLMQILTLNGGSISVDGLSPEAEKKLHEKVKPRIPNPIELK